MPALEAAAPAISTGIKEAAPAITASVPEFSANVIAPQVPEIQAADIIENTAATGNTHAAVESISNLDIPDKSESVDMASPEGANAPRVEGQAPAADTPIQEAKPESVVDQNAIKEDDAPASSKAEQPKQASTEDDNKRLDELQKKEESGEKMSGDELRELKGLRDNNPDKQFEELDKKYKSGEPMTDEEFNKYADLRNERNDKTSETTAEPEDKLGKEIEDLGTDIMFKMANGEYESIDQLEADAQKLQEKMAEQSLMNSGFTEEQSRAAVQEANRRASEQGSESAKKRSSEVQDKIQELMAIEYSILAIPPQVDRAMEEREKAIDKAHVLHDEAQGQKDGTIQRVQAKAREANQYMVIENLTQVIYDRIHYADRLNEKRRDLEQQVRFKLGVTGVWGAMAEWGANRAINAVTEMRIKAQDIPEWAGS